MSWIYMQTSANLKSAIAASKKHPVLIYKHSTRCHNCADILEMIDAKMDEIGKRVPMIFLDLIQFREVSNEIASTFKVEHQSPQVVVLNKGKLAFHLDHWDITPEALISKIDKLN
jgi:bacillithiol system protein YtxJ